MPAFAAKNMRNKYGDGSTYESPQIRRGSFVRAFPSLYFYSKFFCGPFQWLCRRARNGLCDDIAWNYSSAWLADDLEASGCHFQIEGLDNVRNAPGPRVYIANHMSTLETFVLPSIIRPIQPVTFVVKKSLTTMPLFGAVMRSRDPVAVGRINPREDLALVLNEGAKRLQNGISIIIFPQSTRSAVFSREHFNSLGIKLARKAGVPVMPVALKTDAWGQGWPIKDFGPIRPQIRVHFKFGQDMQIAGNGKNEHEEVCDFIEQHLNEWNQEKGNAYP